MFADFVRGDLASFLARPFGPQDLVAFIHVPKTAGSSLTMEMRKHLQPHVNVVVDRTTVGPDFEAKRRAAFATFVEEAKRERPRSFSGHIMYRNVREFTAEIEPLRFVAMLRDPVARVVSDYRYARTPAHPQSAEFAARFPTIEAYVEAPQSRNKQARFLLPNPKMEPDKAIAFLDRTYAFLGTVEDYAFSLDMLFRLCGVAAQPTERRNTTVAVRGNEVELTAELRQRILEGNALDQALYVHVAGALARHRDAWLALTPAAAAAA